jgi:hypothetical protein
LSTSVRNSALKHLRELFDENYAAQVTDAVLRAPGPIYHAKKLRRDWALRLSIGGGEHPTMLLLGKMGELEATGGRLYGRTKLGLRQGSVEGSG